MNQLAFAFGALAGLVCAGLALLLWRRVRPGAPDALREYDDTHIAVFEQWPTTALVLDPGTQKILAVNPAGLRSFGYSLEEVQELKFSDLFSAEGVENQALLKKIPEASTRAPVEMRQRCKDGSLRNVEATCYPLSLGNRSALAVAVHDVTVRRKVETHLLEKHQHLDHLAHHDQLTGLPNRLYLQLHLPQAIEEAKKTTTVLAVLFLDLDRFKHVNDSRGHETGDKLLKTVAQRIRATMRAEDVVVRMGGDEFIVILKGVKTTEQVNEAAGRINHALSAPMVIDGRTLVTTVSIGVALYPHDGADMGELLRHSDTAMYQAKDRGRNTYMVYTAEMDAAARSRATLIGALRRGLERNEFNVVYQPKLSLIENRVTGVEALLRWSNDEFGSIAPATFIPLAEETGLIVPIGEFVLNAACAQVRRWHDQGFTDLKVAVNLSMLQLLRGELTVRLHQILETHGLRADRLELELTESMVMANAEQSVRTLTELKAIGVTLAIDDFGTGYSSLSYLKRLPIDTLKIDQTFVGDITTDPDDAAITATIITMAHSLDLNVVAEGVETAEQLQYLRNQGCDEIQGHWFARPLEADACYTFLTMFESNRTGRIVA